MQQKCGQVLVPTGGGKTMCMIVDPAQVAIQYVYTTDYYCCCFLESYFSQQLCEEFLEQIDNVGAFMYIVERLTTRLPPIQKRCKSGIITVQRIS